MKDEHISVIEEPGLVYLCYDTPISKTAEDIASSMPGEANAEGIDLSDVRFIESDDTNIYTGWKGGAIRISELSLKRLI